MAARKRSTRTSKKSAPKTNANRSRFVRLNLPGGTRQYRDTRTGQVYSRYAYDKIVRGGKLNQVANAKALARGERYRHLLSNYQKVLQHKYGIKMTQAQIEKSKGFRDAFKNLHNKSKSARGPQAKALEAFGLRDEGFPLEVGSYEPSEYRAMIRETLSLY